MAAIGGIYAEQQRRQKERRVVDPRDILERNAELYRGREELWRQRVADLQRDYERERDGREVLKAEVAVLRFQNLRLRQRLAKELEWHKNGARVTEILFEGHDYWRDKYKRLVTEGGSNDATLENSDREGLHRELGPGGDGGRIHVHHSRGQVSSDPRPAGEEGQV
jgi:hypothetical protein